MGVAKTCHAVTRVCRTRMHTNASQRPRAKPFGGPGIPSVSRQSDGRPTELPISPPSRVGFSESLGSSSQGCLGRKLVP